MTATYLYNMRQYLIHLDINIYRIMICDMFHTHNCGGSREKGGGGGGEGAGCNKIFFLAKIAKLMYNPVDPTFPFIM